MDVAESKSGLRSDTWATGTPGSGGGQRAQGMSLGGGQGESVLGERAGQSAGKQGKLLWRNPRDPGPVIGNLLGGASGAPVLPIKMQTEHVLGPPRVLCGQQSLRSSPCAACSQGGDCTHTHRGCFYYFTQLLLTLNSESSYGKQNGVKIKQRHTLEDSELEETAMV